MTQTYSVYYRQVGAGLIRRFSTGILRVAQDAAEMLIKKEKELGRFLPVAIIFCNENAKVYAFTTADQTGVHTTYTVNAETWVGDPDDPIAKTQKIPQADDYLFGPEPWPASPPSTPELTKSHRGGCSCGGHLGKSMLNGRPMLQCSKCSTVFYV